MTGGPVKDTTGQREEGAGQAILRVRRVLREGTSDAEDKEHLPEEVASRS